jgi:hypothetical protein
VQGATYRNGGELMIDYAAEYGIDMDELWREHPLHPVQAQVRLKHQRKAKKYWEENREVRRWSEPAKN